jgi:hypothetical protein
MAAWMVPVNEASIEEFTERRWLTVNTEPAHYP